MSFRLKLSIIALSLVIILGTISLVYINRACNNILDIINNAERNPSINEMLKLKKEWNTLSFYLSITIPHNHIDEVCEALDRSIMFLKYGTEDEFAAELSNILAGVKIIKNYDKPSLRTVL